MYFPSLTTITVAVSLATSALGAANAKQAVDEMSSLQNSINAAHSSLQGWGGGVLGAIPVASQIQGVQGTSSNARRTLSDAGSIEGDDQEAVLGAYSRLATPLIDTLHTARDRAPEFKSAGVGFVARAMLNDLKTEKDNWMSTMKRMVPEDDFRKTNPQADDVDNAFNEAIQAFAA